jgi:sec-independent protein translocase protein TatB
MFDIGWAELMVIGVVALIVVGPKDLPRMLRTLGYYTGQARSMAREFQRNMEDAAREADLSDMKEMRDLAGQMRDLKNLPRKSIDEFGKKPAAARKPAAGDASPKPPAGAQVNPPAGASPAPDATPPTGEPPREARG